MKHHRLKSDKIIKRCPNEISETYMKLYCIEMIWMNLNQPFTSIISFYIFYKFDELPMLSVQFDIH